MSHDEPRPEAGRSHRIKNAPDLAERDRKLAAFLEERPSFEAVDPLIEPPLEITRSMLSLLNMRDETVIVYEAGAPGAGSAPRQRAPRGGSTL